MVKFIDRLFYAAIAAAMTFLFTFSAGLCGWMYYRGWWETLYPPAGDITNMLGVPLIVYQISAPHLITTTAEAWVANHTSAQALAYAHDVLAVVIAALLFAVLVAVGAWRQAAEKPAQRHLRGRHLLIGKAAIQAARQAGWRRFVWWWCEPPDGLLSLTRLARQFAGRPGIRIHPAVRILYRTETEHFLAMGKTRAGKTVITTPVILAAIERDDLALIADVKNDYTQIVPATVPILGIDRGTHYWDLARDIRTVAQAREFARVIVPAVEGSNKHFYDAARDITAAAILVGALTWGDKWTIFDLADFLASDQESLAATLKDARITRLIPRVARHLEGDRVSADDVLGNLNTATQQIHDLANAWRGRGLKPWSVAGWLAGQHPRQVILAGSDGLPDLATTLFALILPTAAGGVLTLNDSRDRRIWLFIDEFPAFGRLDPVVRLLERGGSKGAAVWVALQDFAQLDTVYGHDRARSIRANLNTWIVTQVTEADTQHYLARVIDERSVVRATEGRSQNAAGTSESESEHETHEWVMAPHQFRDDLYPDPDHMKVRALLHWSRFAGIIDWPIHPHKKTRDIAVWPERSITQTALRTADEAPIPSPQPPPAARRTPEPEPPTDEPATVAEPAESSTLDPLIRAREAARKLNNNSGGEGE